MSRRDSAWVAETGRAGPVGAAADEVAPGSRSASYPRAWLIAQGTDLFVVQLRPWPCGAHESITTTMDRYSHLLPEQQISAAAAAGRALDGL